MKRQGAGNPALKRSGAGFPRTLLAERGAQRRSSERAQAAADRDQQLNAEQLDERRARDKRLREGLVGPELMWVTRHQHLVEVGGTSVVLLGATAGFLPALSAAGLVEVLPSWGPLVLMIVVVSAALYVGVVLPRKIMRWATTLSGSRERAYLAKFPVTVDLDGYERALERFMHNARSNVVVFFEDPVENSLVQVFTDALRGAGLTGGASRHGDRAIVLYSEVMDLTSWHGKGLNVVISHHSELHRWARRALHQVVLPARNLSITRVRLAVATDD